jgi:hypothetical protein
VIQTKREIVGGAHLEAITDTYRYVRIGIPPGEGCESQTINARGR